MNPFEPAEVSDPRGELFVAGAVRGGEGVIAIFALNYSRAVMLGHCKHASGRQAVVIW
jgi:hypothetical protein